jgi:hypothetical protein
MLVALANGRFHFPPFERFPTLGLGFRALHEAWSMCRGSDLSCLLAGVLRVACGFLVLTWPPVFVRLCSRWPILARWPMSLVDWRLRSTPAAPQVSFAADKPCNKQC